MPERHPIRPEDVDFELSQERRKETKEAIAEAFAPSEDVRAATTEVMRMQQLREKPRLTKEDVAMLEKGVADVLAFVESRDETIRTIEKIMAEGEAARIEATEFADVRAAAEELHQLAEATDAARLWHMNQVLNSREAPGEGLELGMRIMAARDAIRTFQELRVRTVDLMMRTGSMDAIERSGEMMRRLDRDVAHEEQVMKIAVGEQAARIELAEMEMEERLAARKTKERKAPSAPSVAELGSDTVPKVTIPARPAAFETVIEAEADIFAGLEADVVDEASAERVLSGLERTVEAAEQRTVRAEAAINGADWQEAALGSKDLHEFSQIISDAVKAHYDGLAEKNAEVSGLDYAQLRIQAADDAERVFGSMLDLTVERMERASSGDKPQWAEMVERLRRSIDTERASRQNAIALIETLRASAAE